MSEATGEGAEGLAAEGTLLSERHVWKGSRSQNKEASAVAALETLKRYLESKARGDTWERPQRASGG